MKTAWGISLVANSAAIAFSALLGTLISKRWPKEEETHLAGWGYLTYFCVVALGAFASYMVVFGLFGYVPMSKIS